MYVFHLFLFIHMHIYFKTKLYQYSQFDVDIKNITYESRCTYNLLCVVDSVIKSMTQWDLFFLIVSGWHRPKKRKFLCIPNKQKFTPPPKTLIVRLTTRTVLGGLLLLICTWLSIILDMVCNTLYNRLIIINHVMPLIACLCVG